MKKNKDNKNNNWRNGLFGIIVIVSMIGLIVCTISGIIYRFNNQGLTETQLFVWYIKNYWGWYALFFAGLIGLKL